jgi:hypothetical protein
MAVLVGAVALSASALQGPEPTLFPDIPALLGEQVERRQEIPGSRRPAFLPEARGPLSTASPPEPLSHPAIVSKLTPWGRRNLQYLVPDEALPFRYHVDRELAARFGVETVAEAIGQWDGIPGSRWATELGSVVHHPERAHRHDGHPVVHLMAHCPPHFMGVALANTAPGRASLDVRYGAGALYTPQVDIGVCPQIETVDQLRGVLAHEVGHVMGMAHLCEPGEICWDREAFGHDHRCRPMYYAWGPCREGVTYDDHDAARHLYPTLPRLHGPTPVATSARASYATTWTGTAEVVVLARADGARGPLLAAAAAGALDAPLLLGLPDQQRCVVRSAAEELARAAAREATVLLVGSWPEACGPYLGAWDLEVETVGLDTAVASRVTELLEARGHSPTAAVILPLRDELAEHLDGAVAAAVAGRLGAPLLLTDPDELDADVAAWLAAHPEVEQVVLAGAPGRGGARARLELGRLGKRIEHLVVGEDPVSRAAILAAREAASVFEDAGPVVIAPIRSLAEAAIGAAVASRLDAPLLLSPNEAHPAVIGWLARHRPHGGYLVGGTDALAYPVQWQYTRFVEPGDEPVPSRADAPRGLLGRTGLRG